MRLTPAMLAGMVAASASEVPENLRRIHAQYEVGAYPASDGGPSNECDIVLAGGLSRGEGREWDQQYCGDIEGAIFISSAGGGFSDMDVDCDGVDSTDGDCSNDPSGQSFTAFKAEVSRYSEGRIEDLDANVHPYVVFGNENFDPRQYGMEPLSVVAVICNGRLHYGIWCDTNAGYYTGEASISLAQLCFPYDGLTGNNGHTENDVLYIGFIGEHAVPGYHAAWTADNVVEFEDSIRALGDELVSSLHLPDFEDYGDYGDGDNGEYEGDEGDEDNEDNEDNEDDDYEDNGDDGDDEEWEDYEE